MRVIAHRGNTRGSIPILENTPKQITEALNLGYDVEVDVWSCSDGLFLGHDKPTTPIDIETLRDNRFWVHCKNVNALMLLAKYPDINCFFQENDEVVLTSKKHIWAHSKCLIADKNTIVVHLGKDWNHLGRKPLALCTDYPKEYAKPESRQVPFDLLIVDIDGVMADGKMYDLDGNVLGKKFCDLDFTAIKRFKAAGIEVCFLSGDARNRGMAYTRKIELFHNTPGIDKVTLLPSIEAKYGANKIAYVGDDYYDIAIMAKADISFCPISAPNAVKRVATHIVLIAAGQGVLAGIYDLYEDKIRYSFPKDSADVNPR